jgi:hypothetical protein
MALSAKPGGLIKQAKLFIKDSKIPVLVNRGDLFPVEKIRQALFVLEKL